jgi:uncharacterized phage protein (predicted DNA packaging)
VSHVSLAEVKPHVVVEHDDHDGLLQSYIDTAEIQIGNILRRDMDADFPTGWPEPLKHAVRLLVASFYLNRETGGDPESSGVPFGVADLLAPYRAFV